MHRKHPRRVAAGAQLTRWSSAPGPARRRTGRSQDVERSRLQPSRSGRAGRRSTCHQRCVTWAPRVWTAASILPPPPPHAGRVDDAPSTSLRAARAGSPSRRLAARSAATWLPRQPPPHRSRPHTPRWPPWDSSRDENTTRGASCLSPLQFARVRTRATTTREVMIRRPTIRGSSCGDRCARQARV